MLSSFFAELNFFRSTFRKEQTYFWFCAACLGYIVSQDKLGGVSPMIRGLQLGDNAYRSILNFFSNSHTFLGSLEQRVFQWLRLRFEHDFPQIAGRKILIIDGKKIAKEGRRMPGNKWLHQDSSSNSKPEYFKGQTFEVLGMLVKVEKTCFLAPFACRMTGGYKFHNRDKSTLKTRAADFLESFAMADTVVVADAWYSAEAVAEALSKCGSSLISRVARNAVGHEEAVKNIKVKRGRPAKYGNKIKLIDLFEKESLSTITVTGIGGKDQIVNFWTKDLIWKPTGKLVRFVGVQFGEQKIILLSTDISLQPKDIVQAYKYRTAIEVTFWHSTQVFNTWAYRFWCKVNSCVSDSFKTVNLHFAKPQERLKFSQKVFSYEAYILIGFLVQNILVYLSLVAAKNAEVPVNVKWFRSISVSGRMSQLGIRDALIDLYWNFLKAPSDQCAELKFITDAVEKAKVANKTPPVAVFSLTG